ncbi:unnamed protein product, partial [Ilex paraguariensis]
MASPSATTPLKERWVPLVTDGVSFGVGSTLVLSVTAFEVAPFVRIEDEKVVEGIREGGTKRGKEGAKEV